MTRGDREGDGPNPDLWIPRFLKQHMAVAAARTRRLFCCADLREGRRLRWIFAGKRETFGSKGGERSVGAAVAAIDEAESARVCKALKEIIMPGRTTTMTELATPSASSGPAIPRIATPPAWARRILHSAALLPHRSIAASTTARRSLLAPRHANAANLAASADLSGTWSARVHSPKPQITIVLDMDLASAETYGAQEGRLPRTLRLHLPPSVARVQPRRQPGALFALPRQHTQHRRLAQCCGVDCGALSARDESPLLRRHRQAGRLRVV